MKLMKSVVDWRMFENGREIQILSSQGKTSEVLNSLFKNIKNIKIAFDILASFFSKLSALHYTETQILLGLLLRNMLPVQKPWLQ